MSAELYDAVRALGEARAVLRRYALPGSSWEEGYDPRDGQPIRGRLEAVGASLSEQLALRIAGRWLTVRHASLARALLQLRPEVGDELEVACLGRRGNAYAYAVTVNGRTVTDPDDPTEEVRP